MSKLDYNVPNAYINDWKAQGKKVAATICCHIPEEVIHAAGMLPVRLKATGIKEDSQASLWMTAFSCSYARACLEQIIDGNYDCADAVIGSNGCLMAQRIYDNVKGVDPDASKFVPIQFTAPRVRNELSLQFYIQETKDLIAQLEEITGNKVTEEKLQASIALYNETRRLIRQLYELRKADAPVISGKEVMDWILASTAMPKEQFNVELAAFLEELKDRKPLENVHARVMLVGSALDDPSYVELIESQGALVVTDAMCYGTRYLWEEVATDKPALEALAENYVNRATCPRMMDIHDDLGDFIIDMAKDYHVDGVINLIMKNCVPWGSESFFLTDKLEAADLPLLTIEREEITTNSGQVAIRVGAFVEMIEED